MLYAGRPCFAQAGAVAAAPTAAIDDERPLATDEPAKPPLVWRVWPLFDPFVSRRESLAGFGVTELRPASADDPLSGWTVLFGDATSTVRPHFWVTLERRYLLRFARRSTYMVELSSYDYLAGVRASAFELGAGVGLVPFGVDVSQGDWSLSVASPRSVIRASLKVGGLRMSVDAYNQYTWRVWGGESAWIRGIAVEFAVEQPRITQRAGHPLVFTHE